MERNVRKSPQTEKKKLVARRKKKNLGKEEVRAFDFLQGKV